MKSRFGLAAVVATFVYACSSGLAGAQCIDYGDYLHWAGRAERRGCAISVAISETYAYVGGYSGSSPNLQVIDITNPQSPMIVNSIEMPASIWDIALSGNSIYAVGSDFDFQIIDITSPANPQIVGGVDIPDGAWRVAISGTYAYVTGYAVFYVIDITNPQSPMIVSSVGIPGYLYDLAISGNYAYVTGSGGLQVININNPQSPYIESNIGIGGGVAVAGTYAYIAGGNTFWVIDVSNLSNPQLVGSVFIYEPEYIDRVAIVGSYAYVTSYDYGLQVIDIVNPCSPRYVGRLPTTNFVRDMAVSDTHAYITDEWSGLNIIDITNPRSPQIVGAAETPGSGWGVAVSGSHAYVADNLSGLQVIDITSPQNPQIVGSIDTPGSARAVAVLGVHAYVADFSFGLQAIDITSPQSPQTVGNVDTPGFARDVVVLGAYAYVADTVGLIVIDIMNPANLQIAGSVDTPGIAQGVAIKNNYAYIAAGDAGLHVIDITNPQSPHLAGNIDTPGSAMGVAISGNHAFVADQINGLQIIDISNPTIPQIVGNVYILFDARNVTISGTHAYVADGYQGLLVVNIANPQSPNVVGSVIGQLPGGFTDVAVLGTYAYITGLAYGLKVFPAQCEPFLSESPVISDVPDDQGGQLAISWIKHPFDAVYEPTPVIEYEIQRMSGDWLTLVTVAATQDDSYSAIVSTDDILTLGQPVPYSKYRIVARTGTPVEMYSSIPDSGYSIDNMSPNPPELTIYDSLTYRFVSWQNPDIPDFRETCLYRGDVYNFVPEDPIQCGSEEFYLEPHLNRFVYKARSFDIHGNASEWSNEVVGQYPTGVSGAMPTVLRLYPNQPNPFNPQTTIKYDVPVDGRVTLRVYDVRGALLRTLIDADLPRGNHQTTWDGRDASGRGMASGSYFARLEAGGKVEAVRMSLIR